MGFRFASDPENAALGSSRGRHKLCEAVSTMCRSIKVLRTPGQTATDQEVSSAALQYVRKISGFNKPSRKNQEAFERAVREIADASERLLKAVTTPETAALSDDNGRPRTPEAAQP